MTGDIENPRIEVLQAIAGYFSEKLRRRITIDDLIQSNHTDSTDVVEDIAAPLPSQDPATSEETVEQILARLETMLARSRANDANVQALIGRIRLLMSQYPNDPDAQTELASMLLNLQYIAQRLEALDKESDEIQQGLSRENVAEDREDSATQSATTDTDSPGERKRSSAGG